MTSLCSTSLAQSAGMTNVIIGKVWMGWGDAGLWAGPGLNCIFISIFSLVLCPSTARCSPCKMSPCFPYGLIRFCEVFLASGPWLLPPSHLGFCFRVCLFSVLIQWILKQLPRGWAVIIFPSSYLLLESLLMQQNGTWGAAAFLWWLWGIVSL